MRNEGTHVRACAHKGCSTTDEGACFGDKATCVSTFACKDCGYQLASVDPTNHAETISTEWENDDESHWHVCDACQGNVDEAKHELVWMTDKQATDTEDGLKHEECSECGYKTGNTEVIPHTGSDDSDDKGGHDDEGDQKEDGSKVSPVIPQTGDPAATASSIAAAGVALVGLGALRRRK